jgi:hypothetical protein
MSEFKPGRGLDLGTSYIIVARNTQNGVSYTEMRDCFFRLQPSTKIARQIMQKGLAGQKYFADETGFVVVGQDAIERAIERNQSTFRPLERGILSPREKRARGILRFILKQILGKPVGEQEKIIYSVPAPPADQLESRFDVNFHVDAVRNDLLELGYDASSVPEAEAICYSELGEDSYTGVGMSWGAGMVNCCLMSSGEAILHWSVTRSGDWIDRMAALSSDQPDTVVQVEKENTDFTVGEEVKDNPILSAVSIYYIHLIEYVIEHMLRALNQADNLPKFLSPIPIVVSGGTSLANGFVDTFHGILEIKSGRLPFQVSEVRPAKDPLRAVSRGCLLASELA